MSDFYKALLLAAMVSVHPFLASDGIAQSQLQTFSKSVASGADDVEEAPAGNVYVNSTDLELVYDKSNGGDQTVGIRFTNITIPANAIISKAYVQFTTDAGTNGSCVLNIEGEAVDNAHAFSEVAYNVSSRSRTSAKVNWMPARWAKGGTAGAAQATPDLKEVVQEIISRPDWESGNAIVLLLTGTGKRSALSYEGNAAAAPKLIVEYETNTAPVEPAPVPPLVLADPFPVEKNSVWKYHDKGQDLGASWAAADYDDASWSSGAAVLGYGDPVATTLSFGADSSRKHPAYYLRHTFSVEDAGVYDTLVFKIRRDDGAVIYMNGVEQFRTNMPAGDITYNTAAVTAIGWGAETTYYTYKVPAAQLISGNNVLAVSLHQANATSSDLLFDMEVTGVLKTTAPEEPAPPVVSADPFPVEKNSVWKYHDKGEDLGTSWATEAYDDAAWASGAGVLGYGDVVNTTLSYGPNSSSKYLTYYMRHTFSVEDTSAYTTLVFNIRRDDGAVVYLNGVEQFRTNMPGGAVSFQTAASAAIGGSEETMYYTFKVPATQLKNGNNVLAVSVHQANVTSSDVVFDMEVTGEVSPVMTTACDPAASDKIGCFTSVAPTAQQETFIYPQTHAFQLLAKSGVTHYTSGSTGTMPVGNDFTAYVPQNGSSKAGYLSVNHENNPGGVSLLNLSLNEQTQLWTVNGMHKMDFSPVVKTARNCSGGITPWGTVITSEETYATGDVDADGYQDIGWNVEFDPATNTIRDYDGDGKPDKLWAMGRMQHENVAVSPDGAIVYQGEDGGTSCVYKFVADRPGDLSAGTLYVLKRSQATPALGEWVQVPNTTQSDRNNTSTIASALGGTNWSNVEDVEFGPDGKTYFTSKGTGAIWRFKDNGTSVSEIEAWVTNQEYPIKHETGTQFVSFGTGIDNLVFDGEGNLWAIQDGGRFYVWIIRPNHTAASPRVEIFATVPIGAEATGLTFSPDFRYGFLSIQHPSSANTQTQTDAAGAMVQFNAPVTLVFARKEYLGQSIVSIAGSTSTSLAQAALDLTQNDVLDQVQVQVYPNPFQASTQVDVTMLEEAPVTIELFSLAGNKVQTLVNKTLGAGAHTFNINGSGLAQGIYLLRITSKNKVSTQKIVHLSK